MSRASKDGVIAALAIVVFSILLPECISQPKSVMFNFLCPKDFVVVGGRKCYHFSKDAATWFESLQKCSSLNSKLATPSDARMEKALRRYMNRNPIDIGSQPYWIGGIFDWQQQQWKWGESGLPLQQTAFLKTLQGNNTSLRWHCITIDPRRKNRWFPSECVQSNRYVCETDSYAYVELKVFERDTKPPRLTIERCADEGLELTPRQRRKCAKLLGTRFEDGNSINSITGTEGKHPNEPASLTKSSTPNRRKKTFYICPKNMLSLGSTCYNFSSDVATWRDAHFNCTNLNARLAVIKNKSQDHNLRRFLNGFLEDKHERWIGGMYDWKSDKWKWALTAEVVKYKGFGKHVLDNRTPDSLKWHAIVMDPQMSNAWNVRSEFEKKHYICEVEAKIVKRFFAPRKPDATITIVKPNKGGRKRIRPD